MYRSQAHRGRQKPGYVPACGFTLVELMVVVAIAAILMALALPSFTSLINGNRLTSQANELVASLQIARTEAVRQNRRAIVCRSNSAATACEAGALWTGWITALDMNRNNAVEATEVIRTSLVKAPLRVTSGVASLTFRPDGMARDAAGALLQSDITVCVPTTRPVENRRLVRLGAGGSRISTESVNGGGTCP